MLLLLLGAAAIFLIAQGSRPGKEESFPIDKNSVHRLQAIAVEYLHEGGRSELVGILSRKVLARDGLGPGSSSMDKAVSLHAYVRSLPYTSDPPDIERIQSPERIAHILLTGGTPALDCDDSSIFLGALAISVGIPSGVSFLDTNRDGILDHAIATLYVDGKIYYAETTVPTKAIGWKPETSRVESVPLQV